MYIALDQNYPSIGEKGDIAKVKKGYATNFLIPQGIASFVTEKVIYQVVELQKEKRKKKENIAKKATEFQSTLVGKSVEISKKASSKGTLYDSVYKNDVISAIKESFDVELHVENIEMDHIKKLGEGKIVIALSDNIKVDFVLNVIEEV